MCTYCMIGDHHFRFDPPWPVQPNQPLYPYHPAIPTPINPFMPTQPWPIDRLKEFEELLRRVKALEDQLGCPCEPNKADYLELFKQRIERLEQEVSKQNPQPSASRSEP